MPVQPMQFPLLNFEQTNPAIAAMQRMAETRGLQQQAKKTGVEAQYAPQMAEAELGIKKAQVPYWESMANLTGQQAQYYGPNIQSEMAARMAQAKEALAQSGLLGEQTKFYGPNVQSEMAARAASAKQALATAGLTGAHTDLLRQQTPFMVKQAQEQLYSDPILSRLFQIQQAKESGAISPDLLNTLGFGNAPQQGQVTPQFGNLPGIGNSATTPNLYGGSELQNWALTGTPLGYVGKMQLEALGKQLETQASTGVTEYNKALDASSSSADDAAQMKNLIKQFNGSYDKSTYKGALAGSMPSSYSQAHGIGQTAAFLGTAGTHDFTPEQQADNAAQNMQQMILKLMKTNRLTNYELGFAGNLKLNRNLTPETVETVGDFLNAKSDRLLEQQDFLNTARNKGIDVQSANSLWQLYNNQRPVYDFGKNKKNTNYQGTWQDYLSSDAINAVKSGQLNSFVPSTDKLTKEDLKYLTPQQKIGLLHQTGESK